MKKSSLLVFAAMGFELVGVIIACAYIGSLIDEKLQSKGLALAGLSMAGLVSWLVHLTILVQKVQKDSSGDS